MRQSKFQFSCLFLVFMLCGCVKYSKQPLTKDDTLRIRKLGLLDKNEKIIKFTASYKKQVSGNFYTTKRVAHYWIDERYAEKNSINYAYFADIKTIDTTYRTNSSTQASFLTITKMNGSKFRVYISGERNEVENFFKAIINTWYTTKNSNQQTTASRNN